MTHFLLTYKADCTICFLRKSNVLSLGKYLEMRPNDARAYYLLCEILTQRDDQDDVVTAVRYYEKAIYLDPLRFILISLNRNLTLLKRF